MLVYTGSGKGEHNLKMFIYVLLKCPLQSLDDALPPSPDPPWCYE